MPESPIWVVRAGRETMNFDAFMRQKIVAVGGLGNLAQLESFEAIRDAWHAAQPEHSASKVSAHAAQSHQFANLMKVGDDVITYDNATRDYRIGTVSGECRWEPSLVTGAEPAGNVRDVRWRDEPVARDGLTIETRNALSVPRTMYQLAEEACEEVLAALAGDQRPVGTKAGEPAPAAEAMGAEASDATELRDDTIARSMELIKDLIVALDWSEMQDLVAAVLRAMGYKTRVSGPGGDRGKDVVASPDGLGLQPPRIKVEVKHRKGAIGAPDVRGFLGGLRKDDRGLYVSTGGFTHEARYEAERAEIPVTLIDLDGMAELVVQHYESMDGDGRALVPLQRIYWPTR